MDRGGASAPTERALGSPALATSPVAKELRRVADQKVIFSSRSEESGQFCCLFPTAHSGLWDFKQKT